MKFGAVMMAGAFAVAAAAVCGASEIARYDSRMVVSEGVVTNGLKWIDGKLLPIEGRAFDDV